MGASLLAYDKEGGLQSFDNLSELSRLDPGKTVWVDIESDAPEELTAIASQLGLHELTVEDCLTPGHFPKLEDYGSYTFIILRAIRPSYEVEEIWEKEISEMPPQQEQEDDDEKFTRKIAIYISERFIITYRRRTVPWLDAIVRQVQQHPDTSIALGTDVLAHRVIDVLVDRFTRGLGFFERLVDRMEYLTIQAPDAFDISAALDLKGELVWLRHIMRDQRAVIAKLAHDQTLPIKKQQRRYFKDIDDHALNLLNGIEKLIDNALGIRDTYLAYSNVRLGDTMRILAVITTLAAPLNLIVGLYGMNFDAMPFLHSPNGFWMMVGLIVSITILMLVYFRQKRWI